jgi:hypothetical protein
MPLQSTRGGGSSRGFGFGAGSTGFIIATGGTITTCGDFKIHKFTGPGSFVVCKAGSPVNSVVDYLVVAGGGSGGGAQGGGGAGGGFRVSNSLGIPAPTMSPLSNPTGIPVTKTSYPITVGAGGTAGTFNTVSGPGDNSIFSTITSAGGGRGAFQADCCFSGTPGNTGGPGGSGGGANRSRSGGVGNTPPVSPPQGNNGGTNVGPTYQNGGGGGAGAVGGNTPPTGDFIGGPGGVGSFVAPSFAFGCAGTTGPVPGVRYFSGGGGGSGGNGPPGTSGSGGTGGSGGGAPGTSWLAAVPGNTTAPSGTLNTGGGGGGVTNYANNSSVFGGNGGSGIVIIKYKFQ